MTKLLQRFSLFIGTFSLFFILGCGSKTVELPESTTSYGLNNSTVQEIFDYQDRRNANELLVFFNHQDATYRYITAMALASIQDTTKTVITALTEATKDEDEDVRYAAIYALGQTYHHSAVLPLVKAFGNDLATADNRLNAMVLEGIGKCAPESYLDFLVKPNKYTDKDTLLLEGQAWGIYRFALRGISSESGTQKMIDYVGDNNKSASIRRIAANYLGRVKDVDLTAHKSKILKAIRDEKDLYTKLPLVLSTSKIEDEEETTLAAMRLEFSRAADYRLKINIMRALKKYEYPFTKELFSNALKDENEQVRIAAAEHFRLNGIRNDVDEYYAIGGDSTLTDPNIQLNLLGAALANVSYTRSALRKKVNEQLVNIYQTNSSPYTKGLALKALAGFAGNYKMMIDEAEKADNHPYVKSSALEGLISIRSNPRLSAIFGEYYGGVAQVIQKAFKTAIMSNDVGIISLATTALRNPKFKYNSYMRYDFEFLKIAQGKLKLPRDMEAYYDLQHTIDFFEGKPVTKNTEKPKYNHPINWSNIKKVNETTEATITTDKGDITLAFYHTISPGSVSNFIKLANDKHFNDKVFHRVVPNFVAQSGCPRGDGYGSLDYSIRSEISSLKYDDEGYVGMASAGKDTEGVQFFITHSPAPHLDGKYSIFAKVISGMDVVHQLTVGDKIKKVTIKYDVIEIPENSEKE